MTIRKTATLSLGVLALFVSGYATRTIQESLEHRGTFLVPEKRFKEVLGTTCPRATPTTKQMLEAISRVVLKWPSSEEVVNGLPLPVNYDDPHWCFLPFARGSDLYIVGEAAVREASGDRVRVDVYSAIDRGLFESDRPSFSITAVKHDGNVYVFDSRVYRLSILRGPGAVVELH